MSNCRAYHVPPRAIEGLRQIVDASGCEVHLILEDGRPARCMVSGLDAEAVERLIIRADLRPVGSREPAPPSPPQSGRPHLRIA